MGYAQGIVDLLNTSAPLQALATGGIHNYSALGRKGLNRVQTSAAFDATVGLLKPVIVVIETNEAVDNEIVGRYTSIAIPVYTWIYEQGNAGYDLVEEMFNLTYSILHLAQIPGAVQVLYQGVLRDKREPDLKDAAYYRATWAVHGYRTP